MAHTILREFRTADWRYLALCSCGIEMGGAHTAARRMAVDEHLEFHRLRADAEARADGSHDLALAARRHDAAWKAYREAYYAFQREVPEWRAIFTAHHQHALAAALEAYDPHERFADDAPPQPGDRVRLTYGDGSGCEGTWELIDGEPALRLDDGTLHKHVAGQVRRDIVRRGHDQDTDTIRLRTEHELLRWLHAEACWRREEMAHATALILVAQRDGLAEELGMSRNLPMSDLLARVKQLREYAATTWYHQQQHADAVRELERVRADRDALLNDRARIRDLWEHGQLHDAIAAMGFNPDELRDPRPAGTGPCPTCRRYPNGTRWEPKPGELVTGKARHPHDPDPVGKYIETRAGTAIIDTLDQQRKIHGSSVLGAMSYVDAHTLRPVAERDPIPTDAPDVWDATIPPGGYVCGACGMPTESEPCREHQLNATAEMDAEVAPHDPEMHATEIERINCDTCNPPLPPVQPEGQPR